MALAQLSESTRFGISLNQIKNVLVKHVCSNEVVSNSKPPLVIEPDVAIKGTKFLWGLLVYGPRLLISGHLICTRPSSGPRTRSRWCTLRRLRCCSWIRHWDSWRIAWSKRRRAIWRGPLERSTIRKSIIGIRSRWI